MTDLSRFSLMSQSLQNREEVLTDEAAKFTRDSVAIPSKQGRSSDITMVILKAIGSMSQSLQNREEVLTICKFYRSSCRWSRNPFKTGKKFWPWNIDDEIRIVRVAIPSKQGRSSDHSQTEREELFESQSLQNREEVLTVLKQLD